MISANKLELHMVHPNAEKIWEYSGMWLMGGGLYCMLETFWQGFTHWTMFVAGGSLFLLIGLERGEAPCRWSLISQVVIGGLTITAGEFLIGCVLNLVLHLHVWDYSKEPYNLMGQISLFSSFIWYWLALFAILLFDTAHWLLFGGERPIYHLL